MVGTESRNRNIAQKSHVSLRENLEELLGRGRKGSKRATVTLGTVSGRVKWYVLWTLIF
jgi:hypothetical protein